MHSLRLLALCLALCLTAAAPAAAAPGDLDSSFSSDGIATTPVSGGAMATSVAVQPDGKLVAGGYTGGFSGGDFLVARYNPDGSADTTFNGGAPRAYNVGSSREFSAEVAVLSNGQILQVGSVDLAIGGWFGLARYNADGSVDTGFDGDGAVTTQWSGFAGVNVYGLAVDSKGTPDAGDDQYVVVGAGSEGSLSGPGHILVARYNADGSLDSSFGAAGKTTIPLTGSVFAADAVLQGGKIVVGGSERHGSTGQFVVARLTQSGGLDSSFAGGGVFKHTVGGGTAEAYDFTAQPDGKLLLAAQVEHGDHIGIARYTADGALDMSFDTDGVVTTPVPGIAYTMPYGIGVQADGKILVGGTAVAVSTYKHQFMLLRFTPTGALDTTWSGDGVAMEGPGENAYGQALTLQPDGAPVLGGAITPAGATGSTAYDGTVNDLALLRFQTEPPTQPEPEPEPEPKPKPNPPAPQPKPLANLTRPDITGSTRRTSTLRTTNGTWTGNPTSFTYEWQACTVTWIKRKKRQILCSPAPRATNAPTYHLPKKKEPQLTGMIIRVAVTATAGARSVQAISSLHGRVMERFQMLDVLPKRSGKSWRFTSVAGFIERMENAGVCFYEQDQSICGDRYPLRLDLDKQKLTDAPLEQRDEIKAEDIYKSDPDPGVQLSTGNEVEVFFYDPNRDPPHGSCTFLKKGRDINQIKAELGNDVGDAKRKLDKQKCRYGFDYKDAIGGSKTFIYDVVRASDYKMLTLKVYRPDPCQYLAMSGDEILRKLGDDPHSADTKVENAGCKSTKKSNGVKKIKRDRTTRVKVDKGSRRITFHYDEAPACRYLKVDSQQAFAQLGTTDPLKAQQKLEDENCRFRTKEIEYDGFFEPFVQQMSRDGKTFVLHVGIPKKLECQQEVRFGPFYARGTCLKRVGMTWEATGEVLFSGLKLVPNNARTKIVIDPLNLRVAATGKARVVTNPTTLFGRTYGPYVLYEGEFNWTFQGAANWNLNNALMTWLRDRLPGGGAPQNQSNGAWPAPVVKLPDLGSIPGMPKLNLPGLPNLPSGVGLPDFSKIQFPKELAKFPGVDAGKLQIPTFNAPKVEFPTGLIPNITLPPMCFNTGEGFKLGGMGFSGKACMEFSSAGARLSGQVALAFAGGVTANASMLIKPDATVQVGDIHTGIGQFKVGPVTVGPATVQYIAKENRWHGEGSGSFEGGPGIGGTVSFDVVDGRIRNGMLEVRSTALGYPIGTTGLFLVGAGVEYATFPTTAIGGSMTVSLGPDVGGFRLMAIKVRPKYDFGPPRVLTIDGDLTLLNKFKALKANLTWNFDTGVITFGSDVVFKFETEGVFGVGKATYSVEGYNRGKVYNGQFQLDGYSLVNLNGPRIQAESTINNWGFAACASAEAKGKITVGIWDVNWDFKASGGVAYKWPDSQHRLGQVGVFGGGSCGLDDYRVMPNNIQKGARTAAATRAFFLSKGLDQTSLAFRGNGGAPKVILTSPSGKKYVTPGTLEPIVEPGHVILQEPAQHTTTVLLAKPEAGRWTVTTPEGSREVTDMRYANPLPDIDVDAKVTGRGYARALEYDVKPIPGQQVSFVERGGGADELIGTAKGRSGKIRFRPAPGRAGKRKIVALVTQDKLPRDEVAAGSYRAPAPFRPAKPAVRLRRKRTNATLSWAKVPGAASYRAVVSYNGGTKRVFVTRKRRIKLSRLFTSESVRASVTAVSAEGRSGPSGKARATGMKPKKPKQRRHQRKRKRK